MHATQFFLVWTSCLLLSSTTMAKTVAKPSAKLPSAAVLPQADVSSGDAKKGPLFSIGVGQCAKAKGTAKDDPPDCSVFVDLKRGGSGRHKLEWQAKAGPITKPNQRTITITREDDDEQKLSIRTAPLTVGNVNQKAGVDGLIVTQEEHRGDRVRRRYDVFLARGGKLIHAFTGAEGRGARTWSSLEAVDIDNDGGNELVFFTSTTPSEEEADRFEMQIYSWRADVRKLVARNDLRPAVKGAVIGMYKSMEKARAEQDTACANQFLVLDHTTADMLGEGQIVLAYPAVTKGDAELAIEDANACDAKLSGAVKLLTGGVDVDANASASSGDDE